MTNHQIHLHEREHIEMRAEDGRVLFGFWIYLMTDVVLFAALFAVFVVLRNNNFVGPTLRDGIHLPYVAIETIILLFSSASAGLALFCARNARKRQLLVWLLATIALGAVFLAMELAEFGMLMRAGATPQRSAALSAYFTIVGTHGLHIAIGLLWASVLFVTISVGGFTRATMRKLLLWAMFWHFLDIVWIFIFTIVYLFSLL